MLLSLSAGRLMVGMARWWGLWQEDIETAAQTASWLAAQEQPSQASISGYSPPEAVSRGSRAQWIEEQEMMHAFNELGVQNYIPSADQSQTHEEFSITHMTSARLIRGTMII